MRLDPALKFCVCLAPASHVNLGELLSLSQLHFPHVKDGSNQNGSCLNVKNQKDNQEMQGEHLVHSLAQSTRVVTVHYYFILLASLRVHDCREREALNHILDGGCCSSRKSRHWRFRLGHAHHPPFHTTPPAPPRQAVACLSFSDDFTKGR